MTKGGEGRAAGRAARSGVPAPARAQPPSARSSTGAVPGGVGGLSATGAVLVPERVVARVRRHARVLVFPAALLVVVAGLTAYAVGAFEEPWQVIAALAAGVVLVLVGSVLPFLAWLTRRATITTRRVIVRHGVVSRTRQELLNSRATDVDVRAGWVQSMFGSGDVRINTGHDRVLVIRDAPRAELVQAALQELMDPSSPAAAEHRRAMREMPEGDTVAWDRR
ncbi:PH domain-containing protein [Agromyces salentinus]|uniref:YdbS-like PH domain-containing protein n=1 Tax=Agromyces salentinus TaxID=269421 RepID=A0ABN2MYY4_9MICO|nr:PH domain-containing protein [Agromyces salentinus]